MFLRSRILSLMLLSAAPTLVVTSFAQPAACDDTVHHATGVIRSFGPQRAFVNIAHDEIPGYMMPMTMSFDPKDSSQLDGLAEGDRVVFDFREAAEGKRILVTIQKQP